jgi:hypothetical protein
MRANRRSCDAKNARREPIRQNAQIRSKRGLRCALTKRHGVKAAPRGHRWISAVTNRHMSAFVR